VVSVLGLAPLLSVSSDDKGGKTYTSRNGLFSLMHPANWSVAEEDAGKSLLLMAPDKTANVQVAVLADRTVKPACDYLADFEGSSNSEKSNLIPVSLRRVPAPQLKALAATDGCLGAYQVQQEGIQVLQGVGIYTNGKRAWRLIQVLPLAVQEKYQQSLSEIAKSFKTSKKR
jgi:hypothetical protein